MLPHKGDLLDIAQYLAEQSRRVDEALDRYTSRSDENGCAAPLLRGVPPHLMEAMRYSLLGGGKRLRPVLVIAAAALFGLPRERVLPTACALEMIHTYSLIHDDLPCMDDDDLRRGRPTNHKVYGEAMAVLAGDGLLTLAFALIARQAEMQGVTAAQVVQIIHEVSTAAGAAGMVGGQVEDLAWEGRSADLAQLQRIHSAKTGALFRAALRCGAILGGADESDGQALDRYAAHLGLAFQIWDDVLDATGNTLKTGKGVGRDGRHRKSTYVALLGVEGARHQARTEVQQALLALERFGDRSDVLASLAKFVIDREG